MGLSVGVIWDSLENSCRGFREDKIGDLARALKKADLVVGFNIEGFDYRVLSAYPEFSRFEIPTLDILSDLKKKVGIRISLKNLAMSTLGKEKEGDGLKALEWYRAGKWDELERYCRKDVELVRELFEFGLRNGYLLLEKRGGIIRAPVEWEEKLKRMGIRYSSKEEKCTLPL
jgi:DEAD/DEAH box helicase domain-containing protein